MSAPEYFDLLDADLRRRSVDDATYLRVTASDYELLKSNTRGIREAAADPCQGRLLRLVMDTLFAACAEIARVTGKIAHANELDIPGMDAGGRKLRHELAAQCVKEQAATLDDFEMWHHRQERDLRASYTDLGLMCPPAGTRPPAPQGVWTGPLVRCGRCTEMHVAHHIVCCTLFELSAPQPLGEPLPEPASSSAIDASSRILEPVHVDIRSGTPMRASAIRAAHGEFSRQSGRALRHRRIARSF